MEAAVGAGKKKAKKKLLRIYKNPGKLKQPVTERVLPTELSTKNEILNFVDETNNTSTILNNILKNVVIEILSIGDNDQDNYVYFNSNNDYTYNCWKNTFCGKFSLASKCRPTERRKTRFSEGKFWVFWLFNTGCEQNKAKRLPCIAKNAVLGGLILHSHCCVFLQQQSMHTSLFLPPFFFSVIF